MQINPKYMQINPKDMQNKTPIKQEPLLIIGTLR